MENKCLVCGAIIPEGRQVCPTCKKGGKHEISKKLTDEEIIKAYFEDCNEEFCFNCPLSETDCCAEILELIHRLQSENKQLKCDSYRTSWKAKFLEAKKEIERLTEEKWNVQDDLDNYHILLREKEKQVDELTKQREVGREKLKNEIANKIFMSASHGAIQCGKMSVAIAEIEAEKYVEFAWEMVQQAVKDTAKDILQKIMNIIKKSNGFLAEEVIRIMAKQKGVEVE